MSRRLFTLLATAGMALIGCAERVEDVNRVQPHYVDKALFEGEWYYRQTIVDVPPQSSLGFTGIEGALAKIRWEIREDQLIAYRTHETVPGVDELETRPGATYKGDPVAAFTITEHFDIVREFNEQTGEQSTVVSEDSSLRPWYERRYMRVDWSSNRLSDQVDFGGLFQMISQASGGTIEWIRETGDEEARFDPDRMRLEDDLIQFTVRYSHAFDTLETCYFEYGQPTAGYFEHCGEVEVKIRHSFIPIKPEMVRSFEPLSYLDRKLLRDEDGNPIKYTTVAVGEDKQELIDVACTPEVLEILAPAVTLADCRDLQWDQFGRFGFFRTQRQGFDRRVGPGHDANRQYFANHHSIWQAAFDENGNRIPLSERKVKPIVYYLNVDFPEDLVETTVELGKDWNEAFMAAATAATGRSRDELENELAAVSGDGLFLSEDYGPEALFQIRRNNCSEQGINRYLQAHPELESLVDEATRGEGLLPGNLERVCAGLVYETRARGYEDPFDWQQIGDVRFSFIYWINENQPAGPLGYGPSTVDPENGHIISGNAYVYGAALDSYARGAADIVRAINGEITLADVIDGESYLDWIESGTTVADRDIEIPEEFRREISRRIGTPEMPGSRSFYDEKGRFDRAAMLLQMKRRLEHPHPSDPLSRAMDAPFDEGRERLKRAFEELPEFQAKLVTPEHLELVAPLFGHRGSEDVTPEMRKFAAELALNPGAYGERLRERQQFFADRNVLLADFIDDSVIGLALELKGKDPETVYQTLRREIYRGVMLHEIGHTVGLTHNFQASFDALNFHDEFWRILEQHPDDEDARNRARWTEYRYGSIMDYGSRFNSDFHGLGKYDYAAIKFVYGGHAEVFAEEVPVRGDLDFELEFGDYRKIPELLGGVDSLMKRRDAPVSDLIEAKRTGVLENAAKFAANPNRPASDYWVERTVPYQYCADGFRGDLKCRTWDEGASHTEAVRSAIQRYWNYYIFNAYRRNRNEISFINGFLSRQQRLAEYLTYPWKYYYFFDAYPVDLREDLLEAAVMGINFVNQVIGTPEPGRYCFDRRRNMFRPSYRFSLEEQRSCVSLEIPIGPGRHMYFDFSEDYYYKIDYIGLYFDKINFLYELFDNATDFFRITNYTDERQFTIGYYNVFRDELVDLTTDMVRATMGEYGSETRFNYYLTRKQELVPSLLVDPEQYARGGTRVSHNRPLIYSPIPYNLVWQTLVLGSAFGTSIYDRQLDFVEYLSIAEVGSEDWRDVAEGAETIEFTHPLTGVSFVAAQTRDGRSVSYELLRMANEYVEEVWRPAREAWETHKDAPDAQDYLDRFEDANTRLESYVELMLDMRLLRSVFDWGAN